MDNARFDALARRFETESLAHPRRYRLRVLLLALLGYAVIGAVLLILLAGIAGCVWILLNGRGGGAAAVKVAIALCALVVIVAKALWVRFDPPTGRVLTADEAPALFAEAERLRIALRAPRADVVLLTDDFNAAVSQVPRLGILGFPRNYLVVGLPLLASLPPEGVRAVLAHEFAHLSHAHGRFMAWIYRVRESWYRLMAHFEEHPGWVARTFGTFFKWYAPYFGAASFVLRRQHEYEADRLAAEVVGRRAMAQTLVDLEVRGTAFSERFWPAVWCEADALAVPPGNVFERLAAAMVAPLDSRDVDRWTAMGFKRRTDTDDTHPALRDRVAALLGEPVPDRADALPLRARAAFDAPATAHYLAPSDARLVAELSTGWQGAASDAWTEHRASRYAAREGLAALTAKAAAEPLDLDERWQLADWTEDIHGADAALPLFEQLLRDEPGHASALFSTGRILLARGDERGVALLEQVMERDEDAILAGCNLVYGFLAAEGRLGEAERYRERGTGRAQMLREADLERSQITGKDRYTPATLDADAVQMLAAQLARFEHIGRAYLARKELRYFADEAPVHVLVVLARTRWYWMAPRKQLAQAQEIAEALELPPGVNAFALGPTQGEILKPIRKVPGSLVFDRRRVRTVATEPVAELAAG